MTSSIELGDHFEGLRYPNWQKPVQEALVELDKNKLKERIASAERAISQRLEAIERSPTDRAEREAMQQALASLRVVKKESVNFPD